MAFSRLACTAILFALMLLGATAADAEPPQRNQAAGKEAKDARQQADEKMKLGLELLRRNQEDGFRNRFAEASALEPGSIRAEFVIGLIYGIRNRNLARSTLYFESCQRHDPKNAAVLNNLAVNEVKSGAAQAALEHWQQAIELSPDQRIVQNLGRVISESGEKHIAISKTVVDNFVSLYATQLGKGNFAPMNSARGWFYMLIDEDMRDLHLDENRTPSAAGAPIFEDISCTACAGRSRALCQVCQASGLDPKLVAVQVAAIITTATADPPTTEPAKNATPPTITTTRPPHPDTPVPTSSPSPRPGDHPPLDARLSQYIRDAITKNQTFDTPRSGSGGAVFRNVPAEGALLVGIIIAWKDQERTAAVGVTPVYQTTNGQQDGPTFGQAGVRRGISLARLGYALGGVELPNDSVVEGMGVVMMRVNGERLDPKDNHGVRVRGRDRDIDRPVKLGLDGSLVVGITGTTGDNAELTGFGLVLVR